RLEETLSLVGREQRLDFSTQLVITLAGRVEESGALVRFALKSRLKQIVYFLPSLRLHSSSPIACNGKEKAESSGSTFSFNPYYRSNQFRISTPAAVI
ncbi:MAG: hypothetical protein AB1631_16810, partial [Acidobacteriota bacterium]